MVESNIPVPDPSILTTEQLHREMASMQNNIEMRFVALDKATAISNAILLRHPSDIDNAIALMKELNNEKFAGAQRERSAIGDNVKTQLIDLTTVFTNRLNSINDSFSGRLEGIANGVQKQFEERDVRSEKSESAANTAVNAALSAQKEAASAQNAANAAAITKSEAATVKQIDGILALLASNTKAIDEKIASINGRLDRGEGNKSGSSATISMIIAVVAVATAVIGGLVSFTRSPPPAVVYQSAAPNH